VAPVEKDDVGAVDCPKRPLPPVCFT